MPQTVTFVVEDCDCLRWRGTWSNTITYAKKQLVKYDSVLYIAKVANTNKQPDTNPTEWDPMF